MEVTITLTICLSMVFVITLGIISSTLRDKNFKARFDKRNERLGRIIAEQHDELISYRDAIKKKQACTLKFLDIDNMKYKNDYTFVKVCDVIRALDFVGSDQWDSIFITIPSEEFNNGQNTERNQ